jgi:pyroglutamyl-peptidase
VAQRGAKETRSDSGLDSRRLRLVDRAPKLGRDANRSQLKASNAYHPRGTLRRGVAMTTARGPVILATGFSVFPGAPENPTAWLMRELQGWQPNGARLILGTLAVRYTMWDSVEDLIASEAPDAVIGFGLSAKATGFTLEATARNSIGQGRPDATGAFPTSEHLVEGGTATYSSGLPLQDIQIALEQYALPVAPSEDAGDYVCNLYFYHLMKHAVETGAPRIAGFIHVPYLDEQLPRLERAGLPTSHLKTLTRTQLITGARAIIDIVADAIAKRSPRRA